MNLFLNKIDVTMIIQTDSYSAHIWVMKNGNNIQQKRYQNIGLEPLEKRNCASASSPTAQAIVT